MGYEQRCDLNHSEGEVLMKDSSDQIADSLLQRMSQDPSEVAADQIRKIVNKFRAVIAYTPSIGVCGKTGAGKSSLCNAIFGADIAAVDDVEACTREPQRIHVRVDDTHNIELVDMPGVGESEERDAQYANLYEAVVPELDLILWVLKGDERAWSVDQYFYEHVLKPATKSTPILFVINQVDKVAPHQDWDRIEHRPSRKQIENIDRKKKLVKQTFDVPWSHVIPVSATERYELTALVHRMVQVLPNEKKVSIVREAAPDTVSPEAAAEAKRGVLQSVIDYAKDVLKGVAVAGFIILVEKAVDKLLEKFLGHKDGNQDGTAT